MGSDVLGRIPGLRTVDSIGLRLTGHNLYTWTDYPGFDPEVGWAGGDTGSAAVARMDIFSYPPMRTFTASVEVVF